MITSFKWHENKNILIYTDRNKLCIIYSLYSYIIDLELN